MTQKNVPAILNYNSDIDSDTKFIMNNISKSGIPLNIQKTIIKNINI